MRGNTFNFLSAAVVIFFNTSVLAGYNGTVFAYGQVRGSVVTMSSLSGYARIYLANNIATLLSTIRKSRIAGNWY